MPHVVAAHGLDGMREVAIEEWMGASPVYTRRTRRVLGIEGDGVDAIFKAMQVDIGAPPGFMDFRYRVHGPAEGEFWLASCGALMDVEPMGDEYVVAMCHHIEDPTFDATAAATNPRALVRPLHRPPRHPPDRRPHCHWRVYVDPASEPRPEPAAAVALTGTHAAELPVADPGGYAGPFEPGFDIGALPEVTLRVLLDEVCLQGHLLAIAFMSACARRWGEEEARRLGQRQLTGIAGLVAGRLARVAGAAGDPGDPLQRIHTVLGLHPLFRPRVYVPVELEPGWIRLLPGPGTSEEGGLSWPALLAAGWDEALAAIVEAVDPRARVEAVQEGRWRVTVDPEAPPAPTRRDVALAALSTGAGFELGPTIGA